MWWAILASGVGSVTALVIAFCAYPWQKRKDRELQIGLEQRKAYTEILRSIHRFRRRIDDLACDSPEILTAGLKELFAANSALEEEIFVVSTISEQEIFLAICRCNEALRHVYLEIAREMQDMVSTGKGDFSPSDVKTALETAKLRAYADIDKATSQLVSVVRANAFSLDGELKLTSRVLANRTQDVSGL